jgi:serine/threonine protein phosphatase PrpC
VATALTEALAGLEAELLTAARAGLLRELPDDDGGSPASPSSPAAVVDLSMSGCTACVAVVVGDHVTVANVGDSRAVLVRAGTATAAAAGCSGSATGLSAWPVSVDHKPSLPGETRRVLLAGGRLQSIAYDDGTEGPLRVWLRDADAPGLAMSRSLGDLLGKAAGVVSSPDVYTYTLGPADAFLVLATDGLWEFVAPGEVAALLADETIAAAAASPTPGQDAADDGGGGGGDDPPRHLALALDALVDLAGRRWLQREGAQDDVSILVAEVGTLLPPPPAADE